MKTMNDSGGCFFRCLCKKDKKTFTVMFAAALILTVAVAVLPGLILGTNGYAIIGDCMDGEELVYILRSDPANNEIVKSFMGGQSAESLTPVSWGTLQLHRIFEPFTAFEVNQIITVITGFIGMFLCAKMMTEEPLISAAVAFIFSLLPFYSVYGISVSGLPLLFYACICASRSGKKNLIIPVLITVFFAVFSSVVLVGYFIIGMLLAAVIVQAVRKDKLSAVNLLVILCVLVLSYCILYRQLIISTFFSDFVSHRSIRVAYPSAFLDSLRSLLINGHYHCESKHKILVPAALIIIIIEFAKKDEDREEKNKRTLLLGLYGLAVLVALFYALWNSAPAVSLRNSLGGFFVTFQFDRMYWMYPCLWFCILALCMRFLLKYVRTEKGLKKIIAVISAVVVIGYTGASAYGASISRYNIERMVPALNTGTDYVSWQDFYSPELFEEIRDYIGLPQEEYRVASLALYPSVPLYNGFYTADGYSNNYALEYMQQFRKVIAGELDKDEELRLYFDEWGNRCYLFTAQLGLSFYFEKDSGTVLKDLALNGAELRKLGCSYVFSGCEIENPENNGLKFDRSFENEISPYRIFVYEIM